MQKVTVEGAEITASVKYAIEINLNNGIGFFFKEVFERTISAIATGAAIFLLIIVIPPVIAWLGAGATTVTAAGVIALTISSILDFIKES